MEIDNSAETVKEHSILPEVEIYFGLLVVIFLHDSKEYAKVSWKK